MGRRRQARTPHGKGRARRPGPFQEIVVRPTKARLHFCSAREEDVVETILQQFGCLGMVAVKNRHVVRGKYLAEDVPDEVACRVLHQQTAHTD